MSLITLASGEGLQSGPAEFVRRVQVGEAISDLINDGRAASWITEAEHAIVSLKTVGAGRVQRVIVSGGRDGIEFIKEKGKLFIEMEGQVVEIRRIIGHTHPRPTGPSQGDLDALAILKQSRSYIVEIGARKWKPHPTK